MTTAHDFMIPEFQLGDRMALALRNAGHSQQEAAEYFGVTRQTISAWTNGRNVPKKGELTLWALWTGVPLSWLQTGEKPADGGPDGGLLPRLDSNQKPPGKLVYVRFRPSLVGIAA
jgi:transcriptional regulator with XRE-family HTH domain